MSLMNIDTRYCIKILRNQYNGRKLKPTGVLTQCTQPLKQTERVGEA